MLVKKLLKISDFPTGFDFIITKHLFTFAKEINQGKLLHNIHYYYYLNEVIIILRYHILLSLGIRH